MTAIRQALVCTEPYSKHAFYFIILSIVWAISSDMYERYPTYLTLHPTFVESSRSETLHEEIRFSMVMKSL